MPDARRHRGPDARLFAADSVPTLRRAAADLCWLLDRGDASARDLAWSIDLVPDPDVRLREAPADVVVASADSGVMDAAPRHWQLARETVLREARDPWIVDLSAEGPA